MMTPLVVLILWFGNKPEYMGQYQTDAQCWKIVDKLLHHGIGSDTVVKFQCLDPSKESVE